MGPTPAGTCFGVGVQLLDDLRSPALDDTGLRVAAVVQVHPGVGCSREDEADPVEFEFLDGSDGGLAIAPGVAVGSVRVVAAFRINGHFGRLAVPLLRAPAHPVGQR